MKKLVGPFRQILTMNGMLHKGSISDDHLEIIEEGGILINGDRILEVGIFKNLYKSCKPQISVEEIAYDSVCMPGFIDAHTHICYAGSRPNDYAARNAGKSYLEIGEEGGGIWSSVQATRIASIDDLITNTIGRARHHFFQGVTTIEVKSGYGLSVEGEIKMLRAIRKANQRCHSDLIATCLAAHTIPRDYNGNEKDYLSILDNELLPRILEEGLSHRVDIFIEKGSFTASPAKKYLLSCKKKGFDITVHADQFSTGGSRVAVDVGAISADHLEASSDAEIDYLANSNTVAVALPGASLGLGCAFAPARKLLDSGACLAIASDWNPGSAPMGNLLMQAAVLGAMEKLTSAEVFSGITFRAAAALNLQDRGKIARNKRADIVLFPTANYKDILYHQGMLGPSEVWKDGINGSL